MALSLSSLPFPHLLSAYRCFHAWTHGQQAPKVFLRARAKYDSVPDVCGILFFAFACPDAVAAGFFAFAAGTLSYSSSQTRPRTSVSPISLFHAHSVTSQSFALSSFPFLFLLSLFLLCRVLHYLWPRVLPPPPPPSSPLGLSLSFCPFYYFDKGDGDERRGRRRARRSHFSQKVSFMNGKAQYVLLVPRTTKKSTFFCFDSTSKP